jgi:hypothetical protein
MNGTEEVVKCVQPPLQEVMVSVDVVRVVNVTTELALDVVYVKGHSVVVV